MAVKISKQHGVAGQVSYTAILDYGDGETYPLTFVGSVYGGPIVMITDTGLQSFVSDPTRFGATLCEEWVNSFLAA